MKSKVTIEKGHSMREQIVVLREKMREAGVAACLIPTSDFHGSEYVGDYFKCREYLSGFTGSAGTLVVTQDEAGLWTDGRYFLQAEAQLAGSGIALRKMREPGVPTVEEYLRDTLKAGEVLAFDGRCIMHQEAEKLREILAEIGAKVRSDLDLAGAVWTERPARSAARAWPLPAAFSGEESGEKIRRVRDFLTQKGADYLLLTSLADIAWLLNMRGGDIEATPVVLSNLLLGQEAITWYVQEAALSDMIRLLLEKEGIQTAPYEQIYEDVARLSGSVYYDACAVNTALVSRIPETVRKIEGLNPTLLYKAVKNPVEVANERAAHRKDGVAVTKFIYWLKTHVGREPITERSAAAHLLALRKEQEHFVAESFAPIIAYGPHGAIVHYSADAKSDIPLEPRSFVLADTGGHYLEGTTDITRTVALGALTDEEKEMYTAVLRGHIDLAAARFQEGCMGQSLDILARTPLWERGLDYNHGTGHGVGYLLSVHEGPNSFRYRRSADGRGDCVLKPGMITSDEPGIYLEGKFGIRLENLIVCCEDVKNACGQFLCFEPLTLVPFDLDAVLPDRLTRKERTWLNIYHRRVFEQIAPSLTPEERSWLKRATREI